MRPQKNPKPRNSTQETTKLPYIPRPDRPRAQIEPRTPGELNYAITTLLTGYVIRKGLNYTHLNDCLGACDGAKAEFYRRVVVNYEDLKKAENGDVYPPLEDMLRV